MPKERPPQEGGESMAAEPPEGEHEPRSGLERLRAALDAVDAAAESAKHVESLTSSVAEAAKLATKYEVDDAAKSATGTERLGLSITEAAKLDSLLRYVEG